jgi:hypothetical protein
MVLDAQGYEGKILMGASKTLKNIEVLYSEVSIVDLYHENTHMNYMDDRLNLHGLNRKETWISHSGSGEAIYV